MMSAAIEGSGGRNSFRQNRTVLYRGDPIDKHFRGANAKRTAYKGAFEESVLHYATLARDAGLDGVVCSSHEAGMLRAALGPDFLTVTPGIRLASDEIQDQKRVATPRFAKDKERLPLWSAEELRKQKIHTEVTYYISKPGRDKYEKIHC